MTYIKCCPKNDILAAAFYAILVAICHADSKHQSSPIYRDIVIVINTF